MKKGIALLLSAALAAGISVPAYAETATAQTAEQKPTVEVNLDSIEDIMSTYNLDMKTLLNNLKTARDNKEDHEDDNSEYYKDQYDLALVQYDENVSNTVLSAKKSYLSYCADYDKYTALQSEAVNAENAYRAALVAFSSGFATQKSCDDLKDKSDQAQNALVQLDQQIDRDRSALRTLLNLPNRVNMRVEPVTDDSLNFSDIPKINYDADQIVMLGLDSKIKAARLNSKSQKEWYGNNNSNGVSSHDVDNAKIAVQQAEESEKAAFKKLYDALNGAYTVYEQDLEKVRRAQQALDTEKKALAAGYSTQQTVDTKASDLNSLQSTLATDRNTLFTDYLSYTNMKKGYSTGS